MRKFRKELSTKHFYEQTFWISYIKWYKFDNNNLSVLGSRQEETLKLVNPKHEDWASTQLLTLCLNLPRCQLFFEENKTKVRKYLKGCVCYIFASFFCISKREHSWNKEKKFFISIRKLFSFFEIIKF